MVLVADECRVEKEAGVARIWYRKGVSPLIRVEQQKEALSFYGALNVQTGVCHVKDFKRQVSGNTVSFLRGLAKTYRGKKVLLIWDGAPWHRGEVRSYLKEREKKWWLTLLNFPAYCPALNPQEHVWKQARQQVTHNSEAEFEERLYRFRQYLTQIIFKTNFLKKYT